jgi:hypothetical protein
MQEKYFAASSGIFRAKYQTLISSITMHIAVCGLMSKLSARFPLQLWKSEIILVERTDN